MIYCFHWNVKTTQKPKKPVPCECNHDIIQNHNRENRTVVLESL